MAEARRQARPTAVHWAIRWQGQWLERAGIRAPRLQVPEAVWNIYPDLSHAHDWEAAIAFTAGEGLRPRAGNKESLMTVRHSRMLTRYNHWANKVMFEAVAALPEGEATKERKSLFRNIVHTLNHNYVIDLIWQAHLEERDHGMTARNTQDHPPLPDLWTKQQEIDDWYIRWSDELTAEKLDAPVSYTLIGGNKGVMTQREILLHIVNHSSYHRGFAADLFFQVPARAPQMDLPVFVRECAAELERAGLR